MNFLGSFGSEKEIAGVLAAEVLLWFFTVVYSFE